MDAETVPLDTVEELLSWEPHDGLPVPSKLRQRDEARWRLRVDDDDYDFLEDDESTAMSLVCHDMRGGYLEDRFVGGCYDCPDEPYRFVHWPLVDAFVYFSHRFVTIPPHGWTRAAHENGVRILGTLITEGDRGRGLCDGFLRSPELAADRLRAIAEAHGFDGWLLNVENRLDGDRVADMAAFVRMLSSRCATVVWYDAVTVGGDLTWQNELNGENVEFRRAADAIYLNYCWKPEAVEASLDAARRFDVPDPSSTVYFGVDAFGRGTYGGGGFGCDAALEAIDGRASVAIFAPAWTHEVDDGTSFARRDYDFWRRMEGRLGFRTLKLDLPVEIDYCSGSGPMSRSAPNKSFKRQEEESGGIRTLKLDPLVEIDYCSGSGPMSRSAPNKSFKRQKEEESGGIRTLKLYPPVEIDYCSDSGPATSRSAPNKSFKRQKEESGGIRTLKPDPPVEIDYCSGSGPATSRSAPNKSFKRQKEEDPVPGGIGWWLDLRRQGAMPPKYAFPGAGDEPFSLFHCDDGLVASRNGRPWRCFGHEGVVPLLLGRLDVSGVERLLFDVGESASRPRKILVRHRAGTSVVERNEDGVLELVLPQGAETVTAVGVFVEEEEEDEPRVVVQRLQVTPMDSASDMDHRSAPSPDVL